MKLNISCCGRYDCFLCDYHTAIVDAAKGLLAYYDQHGFLRLIAEHTGAYDHGELIRGLRWIASQESYRGIRLDGGWSWSHNCLVRDCLNEKGLDFCYMCDDFPCKCLQTEPLLERKRRNIEANEQIKEIGLDKWVEEIRRGHISISP
jgi:hypothetical protein